MKNVKKVKIMRRERGGEIRSMGFCDKIIILWEVKRVQGHQTIFAIP
jgi:hypothetical protein